MDEAVDDVESRDFHLYRSIVERMWTKWIYDTDLNLLCFSLYLILYQYLVTVGLFSAGREEETNRQMF